MNTGNLNIGSLMAAVGGPLAICYAIVCLLMGASVFADAKRVKDAGRLKVLSPELWGLLCIFGFVPALALYWGAHHSTLAK